MADSPGDLIAYARLRAVDAKVGWPYLRAAIYAMRVVITDRVARVSIDDGWRLYVNPTWAATLTVDELAAVLQHEVMHPVLDYFRRGEALLVAHGVASTGDAYHVLNVAHDLVINQLKGIADRLPPPCVRLEQFPGFPPNESFEYYFARMLREATPLPPPPWGPDCDHGIGGSKAGGSRDGNKSSGGKGGDGDGDRPWALPPDDARHPALPPLSREATTRQVAADVIAARGDVPGDLKRWAKSVLKPAVDWRRELAAAVRNGTGATLGRGDGFRNPGRLSRRAHLYELVRFARRKRTCRLGLVVDTSGSMGGDTGDTPLVAAATEARAVLRTAVGPAVLFAVDAAVAARREVTAASDIDVSGGGGTDMRIGYAALAAERVDVGIVLTDGHTPWPDDEPPFRSVTVLVGKGCGAPPPWIDGGRHRAVWTVPEYDRD